MSKTTVKILIILACVLVAGAIAFGVFGYLLPYLQAENTMPQDGRLTLYQQEDGTVRLVWPEGENVTRYLVEILEPAQAGQETAPVVCGSAYVEGASEHILQALPEDAERTIRVSSLAEYRFPFEKQPRIRYGEACLQATGLFAEPRTLDLQWEPDPEADTVKVTFAMSENSTCRLYCAKNGGEAAEAQQLQTGETVLRFGAGKDFAMPASEESYTFSVDVFSEYTGCTYYGLVCDSFTVTREDLLGRDLHMEYAQDRENQYIFNWSETKGEYYALQSYDPETETWNDVAQIQPHEAFSCSTGRLEPFSTYLFRVVAVGGQTLPDSEYAAISDEITIKTESSLVYSTVWPIKDLDIYADPEKTQKIGTAPAATAYCILGEKEGMFQIGMKEGYGYIDSTFCMINLPDFIGDLCYYDITNSYSSKYKAHEFDLKNVTGTRIGGYEDVRLGEGEYLVPLLYPTALKLINAAQAAREQGYVLKIYDSYRPRKATQSLYNQAVGQMDEPIPDQNVDFKRPEPEPPAEGEEPAEPEPITFGEYMTDNGRYNMVAFLAGGYSQHNRGVAMDLTLVSLETGKELSMQTDMHDLSWYSELARNNGNAGKLYKIMTGNGFGGLASEWWHFQDNETIKAHTLPYMWGGISLKGWVVDDYGWRYRDANGAYCISCTVTIDEVEYTFDSNGYVVE